MEVRFLKKDDTKALSEFFEKINKNETVRKFFHPHPLDKENAQKICNRIGIKKDLYFIKAINGEIAGYAMLRGWDEGYDIPSFGICVDPDFQGQGIGKSLTQFAVDTCKSKSVKKIMAKVYKENKIAHNLYEKFGFEFTSETEDKKQRVGYLTLKEKINE